MTRRRLKNCRTPKHASPICCPRKAAMNGIVRALNCMTQKAWRRIVTRLRCIALKLSIYSFWIATSTMQPLHRRLWIFSIVGVQRVRSGCGCAILPLLRSTTSPRRTPVGLRHSPVRPSSDHFGRTRRSSNKLHRDLLFECLPRRSPAARQRRYPFLNENCGASTTP